jgi:mannuronan synthase
MTRPPDGRSDPDQAGTACRKAPIRASAGNDRAAVILGHVLYLAVLALLVLSIPPHWAMSRTGAILVGVIGAWRYSWALVNFGARCGISGGLSAAARRAWRPMRPRVHGHAYFLATSYKIDAETTRGSTRRSLRQRRRRRAGRRSWPRSSTRRTCGWSGAVFALMDVRHGPCAADRRSDPRDRQTRCAGHARCGSSPGRPRRWRDIVILVDGDSCVPGHRRAVGPVLLRPVCRRADHRRGGRDQTPRLFPRLVRLRFTQRQMMMSSMGAGWARADADRPHVGLPGRPCDRSRLHPAGAATISSIIGALAGSTS